MEEKKKEVSGVTAIFAIIIVLILIILVYLFIQNQKLNQQAASIAYNGTQGIQKEASKINTIHPDSEIWIFTVYYLTIGVLFTSVTDWV